MKLKYITEFSDGNFQPKWWAPIKRAVAEMVRVANTDPRARRKDFSFWVAPTIFSVDAWTTYDELIDRVTKRRKTAD